VMKIILLIQNVEEKKTTKRRNDKLKHKIRDRPSQT